MTQLQLARWYMARPNFQGAIPLNLGADEAAVVAELVAALMILRENPTYFRPQA